MAGSPLCPLENAHWVVDDKGPLDTWLLGSGARSAEGLGAVQGGPHLRRPPARPGPEPALGRGPRTRGPPQLREHDRRAQCPPAKPGIPLTPEFQVQINGDLADSKWKLS